MGHIDTPGHFEEIFDMLLFNYPMEDRDYVVCHAPQSSGDVHSKSGAIKYSTSHIYGDESDGSSYFLPDCLYL